jgi:hypothetical protein
MKKYLLLFLIITASLNLEAQTTLANKLKITGNTTDNVATKVNVQAADGTVNTILKTDLQDAFYFATASALPVTGITDKLYITRDDNKLYRFNGTIYVPLSADVSGKEDIANKSSSFTASSTVTYANTKALVDGLSAKLSLSGGSLTGNLNGTNLILSGDITTKPTGNFFIGDAIGQTGIIINATNNNLSEAIRFFVNNNDAIFADYLGNVGVGIITPSEKLHVIGNGVFSGKVTVNTAPTNANDVVRKTELDLKSNLASPALTGTPTAPTATAGTNTTQIATTAFVLANSTNIPHLEFNNTDKTVWNNGKGNVADNTVFGEQSFANNTTGQTNTVFGRSALNSNTTGGSNTVFGANALQSTTTSFFNTSIGQATLISLTSGQDNCAIGASAGSSYGPSNIALTNSTFGVYIGNASRPLNNSASNEIVIGHNATGAGSNTATLGNTNITSTILRGAVSAGNATALNHLVTKAQTLYTNQTITANKTVTIAEFVNNNELILRVDTTAGNVTITLPTFTALQGYKVTVRKIDSSANSVLIQGVGGVNIDGASTLVVSGQYGKATVGADLVQYIIL